MSDPLSPVCPPVWSVHAASFGRTEIFRAGLVDVCMDSAIGASPRVWPAWSKRAVGGTHAYALFGVLARQQRPCSETLPHSEHRRQRRKSGRQKKKPAEAGDVNSSELPERKPLRKPLKPPLKWEPLKPPLKWEPLKPPLKWEPLKPPLKREPLKSPLKQKRPRRNPPKRCELNMFNIQFTSLFCMIHQIPSTPGVYCHGYVTSPLSRIDLRLGSRKLYCLVTGSAAKRNQKDEQHEDDQEHDCPSGETTKRSIHGTTPLSYQMLLGYACLPP
jgi:hypothetical protein